MSSTQTNVDCYFSVAYPSRYILHTTDHLVRTNKRVVVAYKPCDVEGLLEMSPTLDFSLEQTNQNLLDRVAVALHETGHDVLYYLKRLWYSDWLLSKPIHSMAQLREVLTAMHLDADLILRYASSSDVRAIYEQNTHDALRTGSLGLCYSAG